MKLEDLFPWLQLLVYLCTIIGMFRMLKNDRQQKLTDSVNQTRDIQDLTNAFKDFKEAFQKHSDEDAVTRRAVELIAQQHMMNHNQQIGGIKL